MLPTLDEFLARKGFPLNSYVREPGFQDLYVRKSRRMLDGELREVLDIANVTVTEEGTGTFTRLVERLSTNHSLFVENVLNHRFRKGLLKLGFVEAPNYPTCFFKMR